MVRRNEQNERIKTEKKLQELSEQNRAAAVQRTSETPRSDDGIGYSDVELSVVI